MDHYTARLKELDELEADPLPTPNVGETVIWYRAGKVDRDNMAPAIVTGVDGPGQLTLTVLAPMRFVEHKKGVLHTSHRMHKVRHNSITVDTGSWDYRDGQKATKDHYALHLEQIGKMRAECQYHIEQAKAAAKQTVKA